MLHRVHHFLGWIRIGRNNDPLTRTLCAERGVQELQSTKQHCTYVVIVVLSRTLFSLHVLYFTLRMSSDGVGVQKHSSATNGVADSSVGRSCIQSQGNQVIR